MPRVARALADEQVYHIINRGNRRSNVFNDRYDFLKMLELFKIASDKYEIDIYSYCLMNNHYHLVLYAKHGALLSACMQWLGTSYVRYYNKKYKVSGHLWQGRYKSFIVQKEEYLLTLMKYVETNPLRAKIEKDAFLYPYSSTKARVEKDENSFISNLPIELPTDWLGFVNDKQLKSDVDMIHNSIERQAPLGNEVWQQKVSMLYGLESSLKPRGRPKK